MWFTHVTCIYMAEVQNNISTQKVHSVTSFNIRSYNVLLSGFEVKIR